MYFFIQKNKRILFLFLFIFLFCFMKMTSISFAQLSEAQLSQAISSAAAKTKIGGSLLNSIIIDVESSLDISFVDQEQGLHRVSVNDVLHESNQDLGSEKKQAAIIRITGSPFEMMIDIEELSLEGLNENNEKIFSLSNFDIMNDGAGAAITILPFDNNSSYALAIGGSVENIANLESTYEGFNVININYL